MIEYWTKKALSSTMLANFAQDPCYVVRFMGNKTYFQDGKAFEDLFEQTILNNSKFDNKFFVADVKVPESLMEVWSDRPDKEKTKAILRDSYVYNKPKKLTKKEIGAGVVSVPELSGTKKSLHHCLDLILENDCKYPIDTESFSNMQTCVDRMMNMKVDIIGNVFYLGDLLSEKVTFQHPIYWKNGDHDKKALLDILVETNDLKLHFDIKYMASLHAFESSFRNVSARYPIQSMHYSEGMLFEYGRDSVLDQMIFIVATKTDPYLVRPFMIEPEFIERCQMFYSDLCIDCQNWIDNGKPVTGIKETRYMKVWS